jgi:hypothetical protein
MTVGADGEVRTSAEPPQPRRSGLRESEKAVQAREVDADEGHEAIEGDRPVLEATDISGVQTQRPTARSTEPTEADPLFGQDDAADFRSRWDVVQRGFVDDPEQAVRDGDELVTQVIEALRQTFAAQRTEFEKDANPDETEALRLALRRYRSFFERLLAM